MNVLHCATVNISKDCIFPYNSLSTQGNTNGQLNLSCVTKYIYIYIYPYSKNVTN